MEICLKTDGNVTFRVNCLQVQGNEAEREKVSGLIRPHTFCG